MIPAENPMTLRSQVALAAVILAGVVTIFMLLRRRHISEGLFYLWLIVFAGMSIVGLSHNVQMALARLVGTYAVISTMLLLALGFLFGASLVYSILLSKQSTKIRDLTSYIAEMRLDIDDLRRSEAGSDRSARPPSARGTAGGRPGSESPTEDTP